MYNIPNEFFVQPNSKFVLKIWGCFEKFLMNFMILKPANIPPPSLFTFLKAFQPEF